LSCNQRITLERRQNMRDTYNALRSGLKSNAKLRAYQLLLNLIFTERDDKKAMQTSYYLHSGDGKIKVCRSFWSSTFGVGKTVVQRLAKLSLTDFVVCPSLVSLYSNALSEVVFPTQVPPDFFGYKG
jgi:hypothetical protein